MSAQTDDFCMALLKDRRQRQIDLRPLPLCYRLPPATHRSLLEQVRPFGAMPVDAAPLPQDAHGRLWGIPFVVSDHVPEDCVMFTTDYETWQVLRVTP